MGVRGLQSYIERAHKKYGLNMAVEIENWKKKYPNRSPILVFDLMCLVHIVECQAEVICGGRHHIYSLIFEKLFSNLKAIGATLVFFSDLTVQRSKFDAWLRRRNDEFEKNVRLYAEITEGKKTLHEIIANMKDHERKMISSTHHALFTVAKKHGDLYYVNDNECDLELAAFATKYKALAVISNDTDFLIFDGPWRYWSARDIDVNTFHTFEYDRQAIGDLCGISPQQRPLFATLLGNDYTGEYYNELSDFHRTLGPMKYKFENVARYIRGLRNVQLSDTDINRIVGRIFWRVTEDKRQLIKDSIQSYNLNFMRSQSIDPVLKQIQNTSMYRQYVCIMSEVHSCTMGFYDMNGCDSGANLTLLVLDWLKRTIGVMKWHKQSEGFTFVLLAKHNLMEEFRRTIEMPIYPDFAVPPNLTLLMGVEDDHKNGELNEMRWKLLFWILSIPKTKLNALKSLPKAFLLPCVTLYVLVKNHFLSEEAADGILLTEHKILSHDVQLMNNVPYPKYVIAKYIRSAHIYNNVFGKIRNSFICMGLSTYISEMFCFDGVFFQNLMVSLEKHEISPKDLSESVNQYRIYVD